MLELADKIFPIPVFDYLLSVLINHQEFLAYQLTHETDFNKKTWYRAKISLIESLREREIYPLKPYLQTIIDVPFLEDKILAEYKEFRDINSKTTKGGKC